MKSTNVKIRFEITDAETGKPKAGAVVEYCGLDYDQLLFVEKHLLSAFGAMNVEAQDLSREAAAGKEL